MFWHTGKFPWLFDWFFPYSIQGAAFSTRPSWSLWQNSKGPEPAVASFQGSSLDMLFFVRGASNYHVIGVDQIAIPYSIHIMYLYIFQPSTPLFAISAKRGTFVQNVPDFWAASTGCRIRHAGLDPGPAWRAEFNRFFELQHSLLCGNDWWAEHFAETRDAPLCPTFVCRDSLCAVSSKWAAEVEVSHQLRCCQWRVSVVNFYMFLRDY